MKILYVLGGLAAFNILCSLLRLAFEVFPQMIEKKAWEIVFNLITNTAILIWIILVLKGLK